MFQGKFIFSQIMELVPWERFQTCVNRYKGDYYVKEFKCTDYFKHKRRFIHTLGMERGRLAVSVVLSTRFISLVQVDV